MSEAMDKIRADWRQTLPPQTLQMVTVIAEQVGVPVEKYLDDIFDDRFAEWTDMVERVGPAEAARYFWSDDADDAMTG